MARKRTFTLLAFSALFALAGLVSSSVRAQMDEIDLTASARLFPDVGPGVRAIHRDAKGRYYILCASAPAVEIYSADGMRVGRVPASPTKRSRILSGADFDLDSSGRVYVADRAADAVKIYSADGSLTSSVSVEAPTSIAVLAGGEIAVTNLEMNPLIKVVDADGRTLRKFGDPADMADRSDLNRFLNIGRLLTGPMNQLYYAFTYLPEPTVRRYDASGRLALEMSLTSLDYEPTAQAERKEIFREDQGHDAPFFRTVIGSFGIDPQSEDVWITLGDQLLKFDKEGNHREDYRAYNSEGARVEAVSMLIEPKRIILASQSAGIYAFTRPFSKASTSAPASSDSR